MENKIAIVTTVRQPGISILSFLNYHFKIGFDHVYLFFDDEYDPMLSIVQTFPRVTVTKNSPELRKRWEGTRLYNENAAMSKHIDTEVMARQLLNVAVATDMASNDGVEWLLHIDHDELFYTTADVKDHFKQLSAKGIQSMSYLNHEAIPETLEIDNMFNEVTLFKKNRKVFSRAEEAYFTSLKKKEHFLYYWNGKSAGKVSTELIPEHVHGYKNHQENDVTADPCILHFPVCGLTNFVDKYKILGFFKDKWFDVGNISELIPFHIEARNVVNTSSTDEIRNFYIKRIMANKELSKTHIDNGIFFRLQLSI